MNSVRISTIALLVVAIMHLPACAQQPPSACRDPRIPVILDMHPSHTYHRWEMKLLRIDSDNSGTHVAAELPLRRERAGLRLHASAVVLSRTNTESGWRVGDDTKSVMIPMQTFTKSAHANGFFPSFTLGAPSDEDVIYFFVTDLERYLRSDDGGWTAQFPKYRIEGKALQEYLSERGLDASIYKLLVNILAIHPREPHTLYARLAFRPWATDMGFVEGKTQSDRHEDEFPRFTLPGVYISRDGGDNWVAFTEKIPRWGILGMSPSSPSVLFATTKHGLIRSRDGGGNWESVGFQREINSPVRIKSTVNEKGWMESMGGLFNYFQISFDPKDEKRVYVVSAKGIYRSADQGDSWCLMNMGPNTDWAYAVNSLLVNPQNTAELFAGTFQGVYRSGDYGDTWERIFPLKRVAAE